MVTATPQTHLPFVPRPSSLKLRPLCQLIFEGEDWKLYLILQFCQTTFPLMNEPYSSQLDINTNIVACNVSSQPSVLSLCPEMDSISQFLELHPCPLRQQGPFPSHSQQMDHNSSEYQADSPPTVEDAPPTSFPIKKPSLFHNFQKHLITTIKAMMRLKPALHHRKSTVSIAHELWQYFLGQNKSSKRFLLSFLGRSKGDNKSSPDQNGFCKEFQHLLRYFSEYSPQEIQQAQQYLCREIIRQGRKIIQYEQTKIGRINKPQEFRLYFGKFIEELEGGEVRKRLPKEVKIELVESKGEKARL